MNTELETFYPKSRKHWRQWLQKNHNKKQSIWLICYKKVANMPTLPWSDAVDEALCFGWIDSKRVAIDREKFRQYFCVRKPRSVWSKINKAKVKRLISQGLMTPAGLVPIEVAKKNGYWTLLDTADDLKIPADLNNAFRKQTKAKKYYLSLPPSNKRVILQWLTMAKRGETRAKRITEIVERGNQHLKPGPLR